MFAPITQEPRAQKAEFKNERFAGFPSRSILLLGIGTADICDEESENSGAQRDSVLESACPASVGNGESVRPLR
jgi:hypothetical protein